MNEGAGGRGSNGPKKSECGKDWSNMRTTMVGEGWVGAPEGPVSRPVRQQPLSRQRGGQTEGTGHEARAWPTTHSPTSLPCAHGPSLIPEARPPLWLASQEPGCAGVLFSPMWGLSLQHVGQWSTLSLEHQPSSLITFSSRSQGPLSPGFLLPSWLLLPPFPPTAKRWWAPGIGLQTASVSRS